MGIIDKALCQSYNIIYLIRDQNYQWLSQTSTLAIPYFFDDDTKFIIRGLKRLGRLLRLDRVKPTTKLEGDQSR